MVYYLVPIKDKDTFEKTLKPSLETVKGDKDIMLLDGDAGICAKYNQALDHIQMNLNDMDIIIFVHDDITIHDTIMQSKVQLYFQYKPDVALAGVIGTTLYTDRGGWWLVDRSVYTRGRILQGHPDGTVNDMVEKKGMYDDLVAVDGCIMFMPGKIAKTARFDADTFKDYHQYENDLCFQLIAKGHKIGTIDIKVEHDSEGPLTDTWQKNKEIFYQKWGHLQFPVTCDNINTI